MTEITVFMIGWIGGTIVGYASGIRFHISRKHIYRYGDKQ